MKVLKITAAIAAAGLATALAVGFAGLLLHRSPRQIGVMEVQEAPKAREETKAQEFKIQLNAAPVYQSGGAFPGDVAIYNDGENGCDMQVTYIDEESGTVFYESELVPPGTMIAAALLDEKLPAGVYPAVARIAWSVDGEPVGDVCEMDITLKINE